MVFIDILKKAVESDTSDIIIVCGGSISYKISGQIVNQESRVMSPEDTYEIIKEIYDLSGREIDTLLKTGDDDFSFSVSGMGRFRCNAFKQRGTLSAVLRVVKFDLPNPEKLGIPEVVLELGKKQNGLILVTGPAGSGKSTTLACMVDRINNTRSGHIITLEDPIEYLHSHRNSIVSQREITHDTKGYDEALRAALRQAPDVILMGEMRDYETIRSVVTAAETGQLVLSTLHTVGAAKTVDRIVDAFPSNQQPQIRVQLSMVLQAVVSQQLVPTVDNRRVAAFEIMIATPAIRNMIRESKTHQMDNVIYSGSELGMQTMDSDLFRLYQNGVITKDDALKHSTNPETFSKKIM